MSDGRQVLHFRAARWDRWRQTLDMTSGEWLPGEVAPLLKFRRPIERADAIQLWRSLRRQGWRPCPPQWVPPARP
ncbi:MAG: DUF1651 domain-containing protein [Vulcanococcus sp.]